MLKWRDTMITVLHSETIKECSDNGRISYIYGY